MTDTSFSMKKIIATAVVRFGLLVVILSVMFFLPAGTFAFWQAWVYMAVLTLPMIFVLSYLIRKDPGLLARRMKTREKETEQKQLQKFMFLYFVLAYILPGFDHRHGWSDVPTILIIAADILVLLGYLVFFLVLRENSYASRVIEVDEDQRVIDTGPYAIVRHPMYTGVLLMYLFSPLALGSYWAVIPAVLIIPLIAARIRNEEAVLLRDLTGYEDYTEKVPHRLLPGIW